MVSASAVFRAQHLRGEIGVANFHLVDRYRLKIARLQRGLQVSNGRHAPTGVFVQDAELLGAELVLGVVDQENRDFPVVGGDAEHVVRLAAVLDDFGASNRQAKPRNLKLLNRIDDGERNEAALRTEDRNAALPLDQLAGLSDAALEFMLVVASDENELAAEHAARGVDLIHCQVGAALHRFARRSVGAGERG